MQADDQDRVGGVAGRLRSFRYAGRGLMHLLAEPNARLHALAAVLTVVLGAVMRLSALEWALVALAIALVLAAEAVNTGLEALADAAVPARHPLVAAAKDLGAAAVLIAALGAVAVAACVFVPHLSELFG
jgi:diacylglycerol kinase (ATP)